jgi:hypothetical protein
VEVKDVQSIWGDTIAAIGTIIAAIVSSIITTRAIREHKPPSEGSTPRKAKRRRNWLRASLVVSVTIALAGIVWLVDVQSETRVGIAYPKAESQVSQAEAVSGRSHAVPPQSAIWVVVLVPEVNRYYPQNEPAVVGANGDWTSATHLGVEGDAGKKFAVLAVVANRDAQGAFRAYLADALKTQRYGGMERIPAGAQTYDQVNVVRR